MYKVITNYDATAYTKGRQGNTVKYIVIHHWGARGQTFENVLNWFTSANCPTSAHYVVEAGRVACIVSELDTAYHAGNWQYNLESIGIECRPEATEQDYLTVAELIANIWAQYGKLKLLRHKDIVPTACPGVWDLVRLEQLANKFYNGEMKQMEKKEVSPWARESWERMKKEGFLDGTRPQDNITREELAVVLDRVLKKVK